MSDEMKLLMAMCDALGLEVETTRRKTGIGYKDHVDSNGAPYKVPYPDDRAVVIDYKVTKKPVDPNACWEGVEDGKLYDKDLKELDKRGIK